MPLVLLALIGFWSQQVTSPPPPPPAGLERPPRDDVRKAEPKGTAVIRGQVVAADTGGPIRQASVTLFPLRTRITSAMQARGGAGPDMGAMQARTTKTDDQGNFEFKALLAGEYRMNAATGQYSAQYLPLNYGSKHAAMDPGTPIAISDGQVFDKAIIALPRGAVIVGRVTDDTGEPMARVPVYALFYAPGSTRGQRAGGGFNQTDDLGQFRLFGLVPGEYAVVAEARMNTFASPNIAPAENEDDRNGFMTTYFPGSPDEASAQHLRTRAGGETTGIEIRMSRGRLYRVSGLVLDSQGNPMARAMGQIGRRTPAFGMGMNGFTTDEQGRFQMQNIAPGTYRLIVRQREQAFGPNGPEGDPGEMANVPLTIAGADVENVTIVTAPAVTLAGHLEYEQGPPERPPTSVRVNAVPAEPEFGLFGRPPFGIVQKDLTFKLQGVSGEYVIRAFGFPSNYYVKAVLLGADDISDTPREFTPKDHVTVLVSSRGATVEGTITDAKGAPTTDAAIIVFPEDKASWRANSMRVHRAGPDTQGHYRISPMHPGRYFIVATTDRERLNTFPGIDYAAFYDELSKEATTLVVNEDETRTVDLKLANGAHH